jgi:hypothetical protein
MQGYLAIGGPRKANVRIGLEKDTDDHGDDADNEQAKKAKLDLDHPVDTTKTQEQDGDEADNAIGALLKTAGLFKEGLGKADDINLRKKMGTRK